MTPLGICLPLRSVGADEALRIGQLGEELGYDSVWTSELASYDAIAVASALAVTTEKPRLGIAIVPLTTRTPALHAMSASTLGRLAPGRAMIGYGLSTKPIIEGWHGIPLPPALPAIKDLFEILDQSLAGDATNHAGKIGSSHQFRLEAPAPEPPLRYVGALGPKMKEFTRTRADGLILNFAPRSALAEFVAKEKPAEGQFEFTLPIRTAVGSDLSEVKRRFRRESASYLRVPPYARSLTDLGHGDVVERVNGLDDLQAMADSLPDEFVDDMGVLGTADECREKLDRIHADGVTPLLVPIVAPGDVAGYESVIRALAPG